MSLLHRLRRLRSLLLNNCDRVAGAASANSTGLRRPSRRERSGGAASVDGASEALVSPLQGTILRVAVKKGEEVDSGAVICVIEAMKMENEITAPSAGTITSLSLIHI